MIECNCEKRIGKFEKVEMQYIEISVVIYIKKNLSG